MCQLLENWGLYSVCYPNSLKTTGCLKYCPGNFKSVPPGLITNQVYDAGTKLHSSNLKTLIRDIIDKTPLIPT